MGTSSYSDGFKRDAVRQNRVRGYPVREVSQRLGVSSHSLCKWMKLFAEPAPKVSGVDHEAENRRLERDLARVTEARDILKKQRRTSRASADEVRVHPGASGRVRRPSHVPGAAGSLQRLPCMAWRTVKPPRVRHDARQTELIRQAWSESGKVYRCRKLADDLHDQGEQVSENRVARLVGPAGIAAQIGYKRRPGR